MYRLLVGAVFYKPLWIVGKAWSKFRTSNMFVYYKLQLYITVLFDLDTGCMDIWQVLT